MSVCRQTIFPYTEPCVIGTVRDRLRLREEVTLDRFGLVEKKTCLRAEGNSPSPAKYFSAHRSWCRTNTQEKLAKRTKMSDPGC